MVDNGYRRSRLPHRSRVTFSDCRKLACSSRRIIKEGKSGPPPAQSVTVKRSVDRKESHLLCDPSESSSVRITKPSRRKLSVKDGFRNWACSSRDSSSLNEKVVIASYNILGVENASRHPDLYDKIPAKYIEWDYRKLLIRKEINHYHPGILCFQEVDRFHDLHGLLEKDGYKGVYKARTGDACDGCAIFWKDKRFTLLHEEHIQFQKFDLRDNVAHFCVLKMNEGEDNCRAAIFKQKMSGSSSRCMVVGNIHVLFNPNRGDIKLGQIRLFLEKAHQLSEAWGRIPVVLAGDLNSVPQSAVYQFLSSGKLDISKHDRKRISGQINAPSWHRTFSFWSQSGLRPWSDEELELATGNGETTILENPLKLSSAYHGIPGNFETRDDMGEPLVTSCHSRFMGTVDYIWHTEDLIPVRVLETLSPGIMRKLGGLPSKHWGSDHLALVCEFAFAGTSSES